MSAPVELLDLVHHEAEIAVLDAMQRDTTAAIELVQLLEPEDFYDIRRSIVFEAIHNLLQGIEPIDAPSILMEFRRVCEIRGQKLYIDENYLHTLTGEYKRAAGYAHTVKRLAWLRRVGEFAFWLVQELQMKPDPEMLFVEAQERWQHLAPERKDNRLVYGWDTISEHKSIRKKRQEDAANGVLRRYDWPWSSWNARVRPLRGGQVGIVTAADGLGKSTYLEMIAEHWAKNGFHTVYVHCEDPHDYKWDRRLARQAFVPMDAIEDECMTPEQRRKIADAEAQMAEWAGFLHYYHAVEMSMPQIVRELESMAAEGICQAVVFDYLDKTQPSRGQIKAYGDNVWERQAADVEKLKSFGERHNIPIMTATQGNKAMQQNGTQTRSNIQGSGQKSQKSQLVIILTREICENGLTDNSGTVLAEPGEYSPIVKVRIDKQNRGKSGGFKQMLIGQYFRVADIPKET